jgi:hypothetical protein
VTLDPSVRTGGDYGVNVSVKNISQTAALLSSEVTLWGVPGDPRHDQARGWSCVAAGLYRQSALPPCTPLGALNPAAFLTLPTSCTGPLTTSVEAESWAHRIAPVREYTLQDEAGHPLGTAGCSRLAFNPSISVVPDVQNASTPTGLTVGVHMPQESILAASGLVEADVKGTAVVLPEGVQSSPAAAAGLEACTLAQIALQSPATASCPPSSKIGTVSIRTPLLSHELEGGVYLASPQNFAAPPTENPFESLIAMYIAVADPASGVVVKLAGKVTPDPVTGQLFSTFENTPQLPFEDLKLHFFGGPRAPLSTPPSCGLATTAASFAPWSGNAPVSASSSFEINAGPGGSGCGTPRPFAPGFNAQSTNIQAGALTPFTLNISRPDADQPLASVSTTMPPGLAAMISSVAPCTEPQASQGTCGPGSLIGHTTSSSGLGEDPFTLTGRVYLTGPYKGGPFGLSIVTAAIAGPFNLGNVIVRSSINVDPNTAAVSVRSDPLPLVLRGIPTQLQHINVSIDRPGFEFNPTSCARMAITGTITGYEGGVEAVSSPFQVANCATLPFAPTLTASTVAQASKQNGASLNVKLQSPGLGQANIAKVELQLPEALPSRLTTIQKACPDAVFNANPATCDEGSVIGKATIHTPVLKNALTGPAYLVSHGGAAFPDVEFVLQGEGITLVLDGKTDIKKGITYSRFQSAPDAPFTTFETELPTGPHSALGAFVPESKHYSLCGAKLAMPTVITAQNGAVIRQTTKIAPTRCTGVLSFAERRLLLARALKACRKLKSKHKRVACEKRARQRYGGKAPKKKGKKR